MTKFKMFQQRSVQDKFDAYPEDIRAKLLFLRELIFKTASKIPAIGDIEETLKWGEPSYVTSQTQSGSTVRIDWKKETPHNYYMYFNCKTTLVSTFREMYGNLFAYNGNRSLVFHKEDQLPLEELSACIEMSLTYHLSKKGE